jgi:diadenosine tetraphosphatase ApaH/serine/threonine PP2A family protein phosphatase
MLEGARADLIIYGHIHYVSEGVINGQRIMSIGSVGFPFDGDQRAAYAIARWTGVRWEVEHRRVVYQYRQVIKDIERSTIPFASRYARMIREANWFPHPG